MKISLRYRIVLISCGLLMLCTSAYAADQLYRFMHNDHDALIRGEINKIDETGVKTRAVKGITSAKDLNKKMNGRAWKPAPTISPQKTIEAL